MQCSYVALLGEIMYYIDVMWALKQGIVNHRRAKFVQQIVPVNNRGVEIRSNEFYAGFKIHGISKHL